MGDKTKQTQQSTSTPVIPEDILRLYRQKTALVESGLPQFQNLIQAGLAGNTDAIQPYLRASYAPQAAAEGRAIAQTRRQIPRGGTQDLAVANILQGGAMQRGQMTQQLMQRLLDYYSSLFGGYQPERQIGQEQKGTATTREPFLLKIGDFATIPVG